MRTRNGSLASLRHWGTLAGCGCGDSPRSRRRLPPSGGVDPGGSRWPGASRSSATAHRATVRAGAATVRWRLSAQDSARRTSPRWRGATAGAIRGISSASSSPDGNRAHPCPRHDWRCRCGVRCFVPSNRMRASASASTISSRTSRRCRYRPRSREDTGSQLFRDALRAVPRRRPAAAAGRSRIRCARMPPDLTTVHCCETAACSRANGCAGSSTAARWRSHGDREMPVWGDVFRIPRERGATSPAAARIDAIVRYLQAIQERGAE